MIRGDGRATRDVPTESRTRVFIVQGKPREPAGIVKAIKDTRKEALATANDFLNQGFPFVTIVGDGRVYTAQEFALTIINGGDSDTWREQIEEAISG